MPVLSDISFSDNLYRTIKIQTETGLYFWKIQPKMLLLSILFIHFCFFVSLPSFLAITLGLTYKFPLRSWGKSTVKTVMFSDEELQQMRVRLRDMGMENQRLKDQIADSSNKTTEILVEKNWVAAPNLITFPIGKSDINNEMRVNLGFLAKVMKENSHKCVYTIIGYADKGTGSKAFNERLSKARAEAVYDCLVKEFGVPTDMLKVTHEGGVDNMFYDDPRLSRAVIMEAK